MWRIFICELERRNCRNVDRLVFFFMYIVYKVVKVKIGNFYIYVKFYENEYVFYSCM